MLTIKRPDPETRFYNQQRGAGLLRQICQTCSPEDFYNENSETGSNPTLAVDERANELPGVAHTFSPQDLAELCEVEASLVYLASRFT